MMKISMLPAAHKKIAEFILEQFQILRNYKEEVIKGSLDPDRKKSIFDKGPHHFGREGDIEKFIYKARRNFLKGNIGKSCYFLGKALHFVADAPIYSPALYPRYKRGRGAGLKTWHAKRRARKLHWQFEKEISQLNFNPPDVFFLIETPLDIKKAIRDFLYKDIYYSPQHTLQRIYTTSFAITEICFRSPEYLNPKEKELINSIPKRKIKWLIGIFAIALFIIFLLKTLFHFGRGILIPLIIFIILIEVGTKITPFVAGIGNPWKLEGWYKKKISIFGINEIIKLSVYKKRY